MKNKLKYFLLLVISLVFLRCSKPLPTELVSDEPETVGIELIATDPNNVVYSNGYDSTGITSAMPASSSVINLSFSKTTSRLLTYNTTLAEAYFFDKAQPVKIHSNRIIGYKTKTPGTVSFGKKKARVTDCRIKYKDAGVVSDTSLGDYYLLFKRGKQGDLLNFVHNSSIEFELKTGSDSYPLEIPTPLEITGELEASGSRGKKNLQIIVKWNTSGQDSIDIILGGIVKGTKETFPYYTVRIPDNGAGQFTFPFSYFKNFPFNKFDKLVFTFIRKKIKVVDSSSILGDSYIAAQSIHNIQVDIPE